MTIKPIYDRLLIRPIDPARTTAGGIIIPDLALENTPARFAEVLEVGHGRLNAQGAVCPMEVRAGDIIVYYHSNGSGEQFDWPSLDGTQERLRIIREPSVVAIVRDLPQQSSLVSPSGSALVLPS